MRFLKHSSILLGALASALLLAFYFRDQRPRHTSSVDETVEQETARARTRTARPWNTSSPIGRWTLGEQGVAYVFEDALEVRRDAGSEPLRLRTRRIRHGALTLPESDAYAPDERAFVRVGEIEERVEPSGDGIEQSWKFTTHPPGDGDLVVAVEVGGLAFRARTARGLEFGTGEDTVVVRSASWVDARGTRTALVTEYADGEVRYRVPKSLLEQSAYPAVLDPYIGAPTQPEVLPPISWLWDYPPPHAVFDGTAYRVLYADTRMATNAYVLKTVERDFTVREQFAIVAGIPIACAGRELSFDGTGYRFVCAMTNQTEIHRFAADGSALAPPIVIPHSVIPGNSFIVRGANGYLFLWGAADGSDPLNQFAKRVDDDGTVLDSTPIVVANGPGWQTRVVGTFDGTNYVVAYEDDRYTDAPTMDIRLTLVGTDGSVSNVDGIPISVSTTDSESRPRVFAESGRLLMTYQRYRSSSVDRIDFQELDSTGTPIGSPVAGPSPPANSFWNAVFDGTAWHLVRQAGPFEISFELTRWDPASTTVSTYVFDPAVPSFAWTDFVHDGSQFFLPGNRNYALLAYTLGPNGPISPPGRVLLDTYRSEMLAHDVASDGERYAVTYYARSDFSTTSTAARVVVTGPDGVPVGPPVSMTALSNLARPWNEVARAMAVTPYTNGRFLAVAANGSTLYVYTLDRKGAVTSGTTVARTAPSPRLSFDGTDALLFYGGSQASRITPTGLSGTTITVSSAAGTKESLTAAAHGSVHLAVWTDGRNSTTSGRDIYAMRLLSNGTLLDPNAIAITNDVGDDTLPEVVATTNGWLVAYRTASGQLATRFVATDGTTSSAPTPITLGGTSVTQLALSWGGSRALLAGYHGTAGGISGVTLREDGTIDEGPFDLGTLRSGTGLGDVASIGGDDFLMAYESFLAEAEFDQLFVRQVSRNVGLGTACETDAECSGRSCVDGVCCATSCGGGATDDCQACSIAAGGLANGVCTVAASGHICRSSGGVCDRTEVCDGVAAACPTDARVTTGAVCRPSEGPCDVAEYCDGSVACPANALRPADHECRPAIGLCDVAERCSGIDPACPVDVVQPAMHVCRGAATTCDAEELCDGTGTACPPDVPRPDGSDCDDGLVCNGVAACNGGTCVPGTPIQCTDALFCTENLCEEPGVCVFPTIAGCCVVSLGCNDQNPCTVDTCVQNQCVYSTAPACMDAGIADAGDLLDANVEPIDSGLDAAAGADAAADSGLEGSSAPGGCSCRTAGGPQRGDASETIACVVVFAFAWMRRSLRTRARS